MGYSYSSPPQPPLSEEEKKRREEINKINAQRDKIFEEVLLELYDLKINSPNTIAVEKEKCGRPTYVLNYSSTLYCPKCGGGVQKFLENKLVRIIKSGNQIYPLYSNNNCLTYESKEVQSSKFKISQSVGILVKGEENGDGYIQMLGNKFYFTAYAKDAYNLRKEECENNPLFFLENIIRIAVDREHQQKCDDIFSFNNVGYDYYYCKNPLRNFEGEKVLKYYRCIKCHYEYHLYIPNYLYYLNILMKKKREENLKKIGNNEGENKKENQEIKNE